MDPRIIEQGCQWWASAWTLASVGMYGNKRVVAGAACGLVSHVGWWGVMFTLGAWGLIPINIAMLAMHVWNARKGLNE